MAAERILFVTGRLAEHSLRTVLDPLSRQVGFTYDVSVVGISVAALIHVDWLLRKLTVSGEFDRIVLPGWCQGDLQTVAQQFGIPVQLGPKDLFDLPEYFGRERRPRPSLDEFDIEILAEINHAPRLTDHEILEQSGRYRDSGADIIDLGCIPGESWQRAGEVARLMCREGLRVSIDSFERREVESAIEGGAELVLSCNSHNVDWVAGLGVELVVIPDDPHNLDTIEPTLEILDSAGASYRLDPVLEPIGFGFAASLGRYFEARRRWPQVPMMMGVGNLTELTEVDSAGVNFLLAGLCQELGIHSILTTEVINWARSAVREFDIARRMVHHSVVHKVLPKHINSDLVMLRDPRLKTMGPDNLQRLAQQLRDPNFRIFVETGEIHVMNRDGYWHGTDAFEVYDRMSAASPIDDPAHSFYLGYELSKAVTALTLGKNYTQDSALQWGMLTVAEVSAIERRKQHQGPVTDSPGELTEPG